MLFLVEVMSLEEASIGVSLMITFILQIFEVMKVWFILFCFKLRETDLKISFVIPSRIAVIFNFIWSIVFDIS